ncbi:hypothetical protein MBLNU230_g2686t1 [Neophaeotheca triangularis]
MARIPAMNRLLLTLLLALTTSTHALRSNAGKPANAILLSAVKTLTLHNNKPTTNRRVPSIPQLQCTGGNAKGLYEVDVMRCKNAGSGYDGEDIGWTCQAALPEEFKLGSTEVVCEGYESAEDPWVLKGSCGVEYRLVLTEKGEERFADRLGSGAWGRAGGGEGGMGGLFTVLFWAAFVGIIGLIVYRFFYPDPAARGLPNRRNGYGGGHGWGGGGDDNDDPPPPYTPRYTAPRKQQSANRSHGSSAYGAGAFQPGFWTGTAAGAAAAAGANYMMGGGGGNRGQQRAPAAAAPPPQAGPSNWFSSATGQRSAGTGAASSSNVTPGSARYESTGFGGTRRR